MVNKSLGGCLHLGDIHIHILLFWSDSSKKFFLQSKYLRILCRSMLQASLLSQCLNVLFLFKDPFFLFSPKNAFFGLNYRSVDSKCCSLCSIELSLHNSVKNCRQIFFPDMDSVRSTSALLYYKIWM